MTSRQPVTNLLESTVFDQDLNTDSPSTQKHYMPHLQTADGRSYPHAGLHPRRMASRLTEVGNRRRFEQSLLLRETKYTLRSDHMLDKLTERSSQQAVNGNPPGRGDVAGKWYIIGVVLRQVLVQGQIGLHILFDSALQSSESS